jgi:transposase
MTNDSIGIDISKGFLDAHRLSDSATARFRNSPGGFNSLSTWLGDGMPTRVVFEATGAYHRSFERASSGKLPLVKVNPLQARRFAQACRTRVKTDEVDAKHLVCAPIPRWNWRDAISTCAKAVTLVTAR